MSEYTMSKSSWIEKLITSQLLKNFKTNVRLQQSLWIESEWTIKQHVFIYDPFHEYTSVQLEYASVQREYASVQREYTSVQTQT